jgi:hypothetical protein
MARPATTLLLIQLPNWVMQNIKKMNLVEGNTLFESASGTELARFTLPSNYIEQAERRARIYDMLDAIIGKPRLKKLREIARQR